MNVIDQVILVPMSPEKIWRFLSDIRLNPQWQVDCSELSLLNTIEGAPGMRWRYSHGGRTYIVEVSAWYNRLGYEYIIVDGAPFNNPKGRIRLQEIPEGTLVQWTFQYETSGMLGGLRNVGIKRALSKEIEESLRNLYQYIMDHAESSDEHQAKSLMQDAPDYEQRSQYQSRYPSLFEEESAQPTAPQQPSPPSTPEPVVSFQPDAPIPPAPQQPAYSMIPEPPLDEDDTRPNPAIQSMDEDPLQEPDFINDVPPVSLGELVESSFQPSASSAAQPMIEPEEPIKPEPELPPEPTTLPEAPATITEPKKPEPEKSSIPDEPTSEPVIASSQPPLAPPKKPDESFDPFQKGFTSSDASDTSRISVFEVFGMQKPSETQEMHAVSSEQKAEETIEEKFATIESQKVSPIKATVETDAASTKPESEVQSGTDSASALQPGVVYDVRHTGLRFVQRQKRVTLRRPE